MFKLIRIIAAYCLLMLVLIISPVTHAQDSSANQKFTSVIDIEGEQIDDYMTFAGSKLSPIIRVTISYWQDNPNDIDNPKQLKTKYEELWYRSGDPLACSACQRLGLNEGSITQINIRSRSPQPSKDELRAEGNALVRVYFDATLIHALPTAIIVPSDIFFEMKNVLTDENFFDLKDGSDQNLDPSIMLPLIAEDGASKIFLCYGNQK